MLKKIHFNNKTVKDDYLEEQLQNARSLSEGGKRLAIIALFKTKKH